MGGRSRVAAQLLAGRGFKEVYNLSGGIKAWEGNVAEGPVELNMDMVRGDESPFEIIRLAYGMEHGLGLLYRTVQAVTEDKELGDLLGLLAGVEEKHKARLVELYRAIEPEAPTGDAFEAQAASGVLEGGFDRDAFMKKNERFLKSVPDLLDLAMMVETQALDLYLRFSDKTADQQTKEVLFKIAEEEKGHLAALGRLRDRRPG
jgi:sulfur-carrier protein adenylyltransferase/sulfurtransferase